MITWRVIKLNPIHFDQYQTYRDHQQRINVSGKYLIQGIILQVRIIRLRKNHKSLKDHEGIKYVDNDPGA